MNSSSKLRILIVDNDPVMRLLVRETLSDDIYMIDEAGSGLEALTAIGKQIPDLVLLDVRMPEMSVLEACLEIRKRHGNSIPIIMLTGLDDVSDKVNGLDIGADDYITKPFSPRELVARLKAVLRRATPPGVDTPIEVNGLTLDPVGHRVTTNEGELTMGPTEYRLLQFFMTHQERVYTRSQLLDQVWGGNVYVEERTVDVHIRRLRKALGDGYDSLIQTVRGAGYRFSTKAA